MLEYVFHQWIEDYSNSNEVIISNCDVNGVHFHMSYIQIKIRE
jgi:hypothetical protein